MTCDYKAIRCENIKRYGTDIGRIGHMLLANRYDEQTHFIFELLQNAEDALGRLSKPPESRAVSFDLKDTSLRISHYGDRFDERDVRGICGIDESTKELNEIGRFGIGFKSVYAFTDWPEIHSGSEDFAIEKFVLPKAVAAIDRHPNETVIKIPFKSTTNSPYDEIAVGLGRLGASGLLFLRQIDEIKWRVHDGSSGQYLRESKDIDPGIRRVTIIGQQDGESGTDEEWLVFSRAVATNDGHQAKPVEIAFFLCPRRKKQNLSESVASIGLCLSSSSQLSLRPISAFLFKVRTARRQAGITYPKKMAGTRTSWNRPHPFCCSPFSGFGITIFLDTGALRSLPLEPAKFGNNSMFAPLFEKNERCSVIRTASAAFRQRPCSG